MFLANVSFCLIKLLANIICESFQPNQRISIHNYIAFAKTLDKKNTQMKKENNLNRTYTVNIKNPFLLIIRRFINTFIFV